jgi:hypothetical protein
VVVCESQSNLGLFRPLDLKKAKAVHDPHQLLDQLRDRVKDYLGATRLSIKRIAAMSSNSSDVWTKPSYPFERRRTNRSYAKAALNNPSETRNLERSLFALDEIG